MEIKKIIIFITLFSLAQLLISQNYNTYDINKIFSLDYGEEDSQIHLLYEGEGPEPRGIGFDSDGALYIDGSYNRYFKKFTTDGVYLSTILTNLSFADSGIKTNDLGFYRIGSSRLVIENFKGEKLVEIDLQHIQKTLESEIIFIRNICFFRDGNGLLYSILNPGPDPEENNKNILSEAETKTLFEEPSKYGLEGVTLDDKNRLFVDGDLQTRDYSVFYEYWSDFVFDYKSNEKHNFLPPIAQNNSYMTFLGTDSERNIYWDMAGTLIWVFDSSGFVIEFFKYDMMLSKTLPALHPSGDIYFLDYDSEGVYLYRIENVWAPEGRAAWYAEQSNELTPESTHYATVNSPNLRFRDTPSLNGAQLGFLQKDQKVEVLEKGDSPVTIGEWTNFWYKVKTEDGTIGWAYGEFLDIE